MLDVENLKSTEISKTNKSPLILNPCKTSVNVLGLLAVGWPPPILPPFHLPFCHVYYEALVCTG